MHLARRILAYPPSVHASGVLLYRFGDRIRIASCSALGSSRRSGRVSLDRHSTRRRVAWWNSYVLGSPWLSAFPGGGEELRKRSV